jgi:REP element-mobilizing transposase RayT
MELGKCFVPIYCFMPDHLHVFFRGTDFDSDPLLAMERFKHFSGSWMQRNRLPRWQPGFHDTILRYGEWKRKVRYIAKNPVRAGLVENPFDFRSWALWART